MDEGPKLTGTDHSPIEIVQPDALVQFQQALDLCVDHLTDSAPMISVFVGYSCL
jgi:hypothetical protein